MIFLRFIDKLKTWLPHWLRHRSKALRRAPGDSWDWSIAALCQSCDPGERTAYPLTSQSRNRDNIFHIIRRGRQTTLSESTEIPARVAPTRPHRAAIEFAFRSEAETGILPSFPAPIPVKPTGATVPLVLSAANKNRAGQGLLEFALIVPLMFLLAVNAVNFGGFLFAWITVADAARSGAQNMVVSAASPGTQTPATLAQITALVANDTSSLWNSSSVVVAICTNNTTAPNGCTALVDPEAPAYTLATVDVTYTYTPFIPLFAFPQLGIRATLPPTTIHRIAVMRMLQ